MATVNRERSVTKKKRRPAPTETTGSFLNSVDDAEEFAAASGLGLMVYGPEGVGKSSLGAYIERPLFLCDSQEQGIHKLKKVGLVPQTVRIARPVESFQDALNALHEFATEDHDYKWLVVDGLSGIQRLCFAECCETDYSNDWGKEGFMAYQQGPQTAAANYWNRFIDALDAIRNCNLNVMLIAHSRVENYKNPDGPDYDRFAPDLADPPKGASIWKMTSRWADAIFFMRHSVDVSKEDRRSRMKGSGGEQRIIGTEWCATYTAKNRFGMDPVIGPFDDAKSAWSAVWQGINRSEEPAPKAPLKKRRV